MAINIYVFFCRRLEKKMRLDGDVDKVIIVIVVWDDEEAVCVNRVLNSGIDLAMGYKIKGIFTCCLQIVVLRMHY